MRAILVTACVWGGAAAADIPRVAVDIAPVHSIVAAVMGDLGQPNLIVSPGASPHGYSMRPSEARALDQADVVVWVGEGLASWLSGPITELAAGAEVIELLDLPGTQLLEIRENAAFGSHDDHGHGAAHDGDDHDDHEAKVDDDHDENGHEDHADEVKADADHDHAHDDHAQDDHDDHAPEAHDDHAAEAHDDHDDHEGEDHADAHADHDHGAFDPHAWLDPQNAVIWAQTIAQVLAEKDPENSAVYTSNAEAFASDMNALQDEVTAILAPVTDRPFVVFHDAYHYFENRFGVEAVGAVSASDAAAPSPARVAALRDEVAGFEAVCAMREPQFAGGMLESLGTVKLGEMDPMGAALEVGPTLYSELLRGMATSLANCLK
ncbi:zinc ABC transporter substrate-binding protein [uncultured Tateyamaria sp.]|uniref:zinc ABC transporter substrate-binding protein n=1 Tax=uncultured Tateyamaria sp. TaxID=455651 RepID=UPI00262621A3|nr:zinc ABC transporter substrate-binding protein [uncultured Tateyamaria sp.]